MKKLILIVLKNYEIIFSNNSQNELIYLEEQKIENILRNAFEIVHLVGKRGSSGSTGEKINNC